MPRLPTVLTPANYDEYVRFTEKAWGDLDGFYTFWSSRWRQVMEYLRSQHWKTLQSLEPKAVPAWEEWPILASVEAVFTDYMKQWMQSRVRFSALPDSPDPNEINAAELADHVLRYLWDKHVEPLRADLGAWLLATGNADLRVFWNTDTGNLLPLAVPGEDGQLIPVDPNTLQPDPTREQPVMVDAGDIGVEVVSPQLVRWPFNKAHGVMVGYLISYDEVEARYGKEIAEKLGYTKVKAALQSDLLVIDDYGLQAVATDAALVVEHHLPRSFRYPNGLWWTSSGKTMITPPNPLPTGELPVIPFRWTPMPGHPTMGTSPLLGVRHITKIGEKSLKQSLEWQKKVKPVRLLPAGGGIRRGEIDDAIKSDGPAAEVTYNVGGKPEFDQPPQPPPSFENLREELKGELQIAALYQFRQPERPVPGEASRWRQPQQTINQGQEVSLAILNSSESWKKLGYVLLGYVAKFYTEPRSIAIIGPDRSYQWREFVGSDLSNLRATIRLDEVALYTWNRQAIRDTVVGVLSSPAASVLFSSPDGQIDRERLDAALEAAGLEQGLQTLDPDVIEAKNEISFIRGLSEGSEPPLAKPWQDHAVHISEKYKIVKSLGFLGWTEHAKLALMQNIASHEQAVAEAQRQAQEQMLSQEQALRQIRATAEGERDARTALAQALAKTLAEIISGRDKPEKKD